MIPTPGTQHPTPARSPNFQRLTSPFDTRHPPSRALIDDCVHCGFCLPVCPTYVLWGEEMDSPRGRIYLMKLGLDGQLALSDGYVRYFDQCLSCLACVTACPSGVQYDKLIEATRAQLERRFARALSDRLFRRLIFSFFPYPERLRLIALPLWLYQRVGLHRFASTSRLPARLQAMASLAPRFSLRAALRRAPTRVPAAPRRTGRRIQGSESSLTPDSHLPTTSKPRRVGLLLGCIQQVFFADVNAATARVLAAEGCEVIIPPGQGCCGALGVHAGQEALATAMAKRTIDAFEAADVDTIAINAAGCGSTMKQYDHLLRDDPDYAERAQRFATKCRDISEVLAELPVRAPRWPLPVRIAYHDACHLQHAQGIRAQPRAVLAGVPGLEVVEVPEAVLCCGSAGIYSLVQPEPARALGDRKVRNVLSTGAVAVVSSNPGCLLQLQSGLARAGRSLPVYHLVEVVDASIRGTKLPRR